jgi:hypothetical protein
MTDERRARGSLVDLMSSGIRNGGAALDALPTLLMRLIGDDEEGWRDFVTKRGEEVHHERFADFVTTRPLAGLGASVDVVRRLVDGPDEVNRRAVDALDRLTENPTGVNNVNTPRPTGNSQDRALRKLRKDAPEMHADVLAGKLTAHAAMVQAGFRPRTISIPIDRPEVIAAALRRHMSPEDYQEVGRLLRESLDA